MRANARRFLLAVVLAAAWLGLNVAFPDLGPTGIPATVTRLLIHGIILVGLWLGLSRTDFTRGTRVRLWLAIAVPFTLWLALVWRLAVDGFFRAIPGVIRVPPPLPVAIFLPVVVGLVLLMRSNRIAALLDAMPLSWLMGLQLYRILGGIFLVNWAQGAIPGVFALPAGIGDTMVGLLALPAAWWASSGTPPGARARPPECASRHVPDRDDPGLRGAELDHPARALSLAIETPGPTDGAPHPDRLAP
jgi:hypothetical protein